MHDVVNPANEQVIATVPSTSVEQTDEAIARDVTAFRRRFGRLHYVR